MEKSHFLGDWGFFMWFLVILLVGTGEPPPYCNKNTLGKIESKFGIGRPPPLSWDKRPNFSNDSIWRLPFNICCVQLLGASEVWGDMYSMYSVAPFREAMLSGAGHCRAYIVIFLQEVCYAQRGCEASCVWRKQEILYVSGAGQCWVNIVYIRTRWQVLGWIFSSPAGISNCLQEQRRVDTSFSVFVFEIAAIFPHRSCAYCTSPRSGQCTYPLPLGSKIL